MEQLLKNQLIVFFLAIFMISVNYAQNYKEIKDVDEVIGLYLSGATDYSLSEENKTRIIKSLSEESVLTLEEINRLLEIERIRLLKYKFYNDNPYLFKAINDNQFSLLQTTIDFEGGDLGGFNLLTGSTIMSCGLNEMLIPEIINTDVSNIPQDAYATLVSNGVDPLIASLSDQYGNPPASLSPTNGGNRALRINQYKNSGFENHEVDIVYKNFISNGNPISFDFAPVFDFWGQGLEDENPYFEAQVINLDNGNIIDSYCLEASNNTFQFTILNHDGTIENKNYVVFKNWTTRTLSSGSQGLNIQLRFIAGDCSHSTHAGYVYLDNIIIDEQDDNCNNVCDIVPQINVLDASCDVSLLASNNGVECGSHIYEWNVDGNFAGNGDMLNLSYNPNTAPNSINVTLKISSIDGICIESVSQIINIDCDDACFNCNIENGVEQLLNAIDEVDNVCAQYNLKMPAFIPSCDNGQLMINWGDGIVEALGGGNSDNFHTYSNNGTYTISVYVDINGVACSGSTREITVDCLSNCQYQGSCKDIIWTITQTMENVDNCETFELTVDSTFLDCYIIQYKYFGSDYINLPAGTSQITLPTSGGVISFRVLNFDGSECYSTNYNTGVSVCGNSNLNKTLIYPNPYSKGEKLFFQKIDDSTIDLELLDVKGVLRKEYKTNLNYIVINDVESGVYWIKLKTKMGNEVRKIIIK